MANLDLKMEDVAELFRVMPESFKQVQLIVQARVILELEEKVNSLEGGSNAESREKDIPVHSKGKDAGKS
jgi:hypothetical protein|tara:strand:+ start:231 stop:440 length:210 start_codon:yes stop_codon:yes gene_type:complete